MLVSLRGYLGWVYIYNMPAATSQLLLVLHSSIHITDVPFLSLYSNISSLSSFQPISSFFPLDMSIHYYLIMPRFITSPPVRHTCMHKSGPRNSSSLNTNFTRQPHHVDTFYPSLFFYIHIIFVFFSNTSYLFFHFMIDMHIYLLASKL